MPPKIPDPQAQTDLDKVRTMMQNAEKAGEFDQAKRCFRRLCELQGRDFDDPLEKRFWETMAAYEESLHRKHGRKVQASYTRRKVGNKGIHQTLADWALDRNPSDGFIRLVEDGLVDFTGEYLVVQFADRFEPNVVEAARQRLSDYDVKV